jgi:hypothetical protein
MTAINEVFDKYQGNPGYQGIGFIAASSLAGIHSHCRLVIGRIYTLNLSETERVTNYFKGLIY